MSASLGKGSLIDLTPGGFDINNPWPPEVARFFEAYHHGMQNLSGANIDGSQVTWSPFTMFGPANFGIQTDGINANVSWNLANDPSGHFVQYILVEDHGMTNLYRPGGDLFQNGGFATIDGITPMIGITFAGTNNIPDSGPALALFGIGLLGLLLASRRLV